MNSRIESILTLAASLGILLFFAFGWPGVRRGETDLLSFYTGAKLVGTPHLYSYSHVHAAQKQFSPKPGELRAYTRLPFYALFLKPLAWLSYREALVVWQALNLAAFLGFVLLWSRSPLALPLCCWYFPAWINFVLAQDVALLLFCAAACVALIERGQRVAAGLVLALCAVKVHLVLLAPIPILAKRLWGTAAGLAGGGAALLAISFAVGGRDWPVRYLALLRRNEQMQASADQMPNLYGLLHTLPHGTLWVAVLTAAVLVATWYVSRREPIRPAFAFALCGGLLASVHAFAGDFPLLLPFILSLLDRFGPRRAIYTALGAGVAAFTLTVPPFSRIGQLALIALFGSGVYDAWRHPAGSPRPAAASQNGVK